MSASCKKVLATLGVCALVSLGATGCVKQMLINGQLQSTRNAAPAIDTLGDLEVARGVAFGSVGTLEGLHRLAPANADGLFLLAKGWSGVGFAFHEDDFESATDRGDEEAAEDARTRARAAYTRAVFYGLELLEHKAQDFEPHKKNVESMRAWLRNFDQEDVPALFWTGYAWIARVNVSKDIPEMIGELHVGVTMMERAVELDERYLDGLGHVVLGAYHARTPMSELDDARKHFERALDINGGKLLVTKFQFARTYFCFKNDKENYLRLLREVVDAGDPYPEQRLSNTIAKRRAKRYLSEKRQADCGF
jgi:tetratricopeptide (TPR) repeat protein